MGRVPALARAAEFLGPLLIRGLGHTWHARILPRGRNRKWGKGPAVWAFWHGRMLMTAYLYRGSRTGILVSRHRDGEYIARPVDRLGLVPLRGSSTRGGVPGLKAMIEHGRKGENIAFTPDGPKGPRYVVQPGVIYAASRTGLPLVPLGVEASPSWVLGSWDEFTIPKPFARVVVLEGEAMRVPRHLPGDKLEEYRLELERRMHEAMEQARRILAETRSPVFR